MIKLSTILSSFDDKATLLKWLKKVEKALANDILQNITSKAVSATQSKLVFHFADGTELETPAFTVKGDKGNTGATGPQGPQGPQGPAGEDGSDAEVNAENLLNVLEGSETIVVDEAEDGEHVEIHLDAEVLAKIENALQTPLIITEKSLVAVDTDKSQVMLRLDPNTLEFAGGFLKVKNINSGTKLYKHNISFVSASENFNITCITTDNTNLSNQDWMSKVCPLIDNSLLTYVKIENPTEFTEKYGVIYGKKSSAGILFCIGADSGGTQSIAFYFHGFGTTIFDTVTEL